MKTRHFRQGETIRCLCQAGDYVMWMRICKPFAADKYQRAHNRLFVREDEGAFTFAREQK